MTNLYGRAVAQTASALAGLRRAMIRERTRNAMGVKRSGGERICGHAPFGLDFGAGGRLVASPGGQRCIARAAAAVPAAVLVVPALNRAGSAVRSGPGHPAAFPLRIGTCPDSGLGLPGDGVGRTAAYPHGAGGT